MKLRESLAMKIAAVILSYVCVLTLVISAAAVVVMGYYKFYFSDNDTVTQEILTDMAQKEAHYVENLMWQGRDLNDYYSDKNVYFTVTDSKTGTVYDTNYNGENYRVTSEAIIYIENYYPIDMKAELDEVYGKEDYYIYEDSESIGVIEEYAVNIYISEKMTKNDIFSVTAKIIEIGFSMRYAVLFIFLLSLICGITVLSYLYCATGHKSTGVIAENFIDRIPFEIPTAFTVAAAIISVIAVVEWSYDLSSAIIWIFLLGTVDYFIALGYTLSFATRIKTGTLIKNTIIYRVLAFLGKYLKKIWQYTKYIFSNISLVYKTVLIIVSILFLEVIGIIISMNTYWYMPELLVFGIISANIIFIAAALYLAITLQRIKMGGEKIAGGDLEHKIKTQYMYGDFKAFAESLNNINLGLQNAVNEKMKSERFKTELITNVSHDIKTPLTSIINYVDLIKKEEPENETVKQYIEVLDRQSNRLKKLVEDLVEASKASSGSLAVNLAVCDAGVLLTQTLGEFEDRLNKLQLKPVLKLNEKPLKIMADGRHLWRVFDNLMSNVCKYALEGTRVYIDVMESGGKVTITFRNISKYQLNVSADELMERFVRGDTSRNTEGSGLGLSIAKSLVELQGGAMELSVDGDLFKVAVVFDVVDF